VLQHRIYRRKHVVIQGDLKLVALGSRNLIRRVAQDFRRFAFSRLVEQAHARGKSIRDVCAGTQNKGGELGNHWFALFNVLCGVQCEHVCYKAIAAKSTRDRTHNELAGEYRECDHSNSSRKPQDDERSWPEDRHQ
jgi:hypothetical protein